VLLGRSCGHAISDTTSLTGKKFWFSRNDTANLIGNMNASASSDGIRLIGIEFLRVIRHTVDNIARLIGKRSALVLGGITKLIAKRFEPISNAIVKFTRKNAELTRNDIVRLIGKKLMLALNDIAKLIGKRYGPIRNGIRSSTVKFIGKKFELMTDSIAKLVERQLRNDHSIRQVLRRHRLGLR